MRQRIKAYTFAGMPLGMMILPGFLFIPLRDYVDMENYGNRVYQEKPVLNFRNLSAADLKSYPGQYDAYFNGYLALKNPIVAFGKLADIHVFGEVTSDAVLIGKDEWMFYKLKGEVEGSIADRQGINYYSIGETERFGVLPKQAEGNLTPRGIKLVSYMVPSKEQAYSEFMPSSVKVVQKQSKADLSYEYLKENTDYDVYYPLDEFRKVKDDWCQIYRKYDTHWNDMGAFTVSQMVMQDIDGELFGLELYRSYDIENRETFSGDLATMLNLQKYYDDDPFPEVSGCREDVSFEMDYQNEHKTITRYSSDAEEKAEGILICRDSFGVHMAEYSTRNYPDITPTDYRTEDCGAAALKIQLDVVVIEVVERYVDYMFGLLERLGTIGSGDGTLKRATVD